MSRESSASARSKNQILKPEFLRRTARVIMAERFCFAPPNQREQLASSVSQSLCEPFFSVAAIAARLTNKNSL
jgi:hypothetical protein